MFTERQRAQLRTDLLDCARDDSRISGAAITGSAAEDREDRWSDIDLAFGVSDPAGLDPVLADWTARLYNDHGAIDHLDVNAGPWIYRVFLLPGTLQVDLAFVPAADFGALAPSFRLVWGEAKEPLHFPAPAPGDAIRWAWLHALHARTCIARGKPWQAEHMISAVRDHAFTLACLRHGLPPAHGRGNDQLPEALRSELEAALVRGLDAAELQRAFEAAMRVLMNEIEAADHELAARLGASLSEIAQVNATSSAD